jgi:hypothetical protein
VALLKRSSKVERAGDNEVLGVAVGFEFINPRPQWRRRNGMHDAHRGGFPYTAISS